MRAAYYNRLGPASEVIEIGEMPPPRAGPGEELAATLDDIDRRLAAGVLTPTVARRFALEETARAHEALEAGGQFGGIVVEIESGASG